MLTAETPSMLPPAQLFTLAEQHYLAGRLGQAEEMCRLVLQADERHAAAWRMLGVLCQRAGRAAEAVAHLREAMRLQPDSADTHFQLGVALAVQGNWLEAEGCYREALLRQPTFALAHSNLGAALAGQGRFAAAEACYRTALRLQPDSALTHSNLGVALATQGRPAEAVVCHQEALGLQPGYAEGHFNLGEALLALHQPVMAAASFAEAVRLKPAFAEAHHRLGFALAAQGRLAEATASYEHALQLKPGDGEAHRHLGEVLTDLRRLDEAAVCFENARRLSPDDAEIHRLLGVVYARQGKLAEAEASCREALRLRPDYPEAHNKLGAVLLAQGQLAEAEVHCRHAIQLKPNYADPLGNLGMALAQQLRLAEADACFQQFLRFEPKHAEVNFNRAVFWLMAGDFEQGWPAFEWRWQLPQYVLPSPRPPRWDGTSLAGRTILLLCEQGLGDVLQFVRYAPLVKERGGTAILQCPEPLLPLLGSCSGVDSLFPVGAALPPADVQAPLLSLPGIFRTNLASIPANIPYLVAPPDRCERWRHRLAGLAGFKIGIAWQGNLGHKYDRWRSASPEEFAPLAGVPGVRLVSLQTGPGQQQMAGLAGRWTLTDLADELHDFADTAAAMAHVDLVVTVDTAVAHLAGALGVPVWVALPAFADWRWLLHRTDSPWYPGMRLFRQDTWGDWSGVFQRMATALHNLL
jgi:tetratricopeptide (TPR) repeat protein